MTLPIQNILESAVITPTVSTDHFEKELHAPFQQGTLKQKQWLLDEMEINYYEWQLKELLVTEWSVPRNQISMLFMLQGEMQCGDRRLSNMQQTAIEGKCLLNFNQLHERYLEVRISRKLVQQVIPTYQPSAEPTFINIQTYACIEDILHCKLKGDYKKAYLRAKCIELLALQAAAFEQGKEQKYIYCKTEYDKERILFAREYLLQNYDLPPTLPELARMAGINEFKLKKGFKELFGDTVFGYLHEYKMDLAKRELGQGEKTASQLAYDLGYSSLQHFSNVFKRHFGYPPSHFKR
jgi:AraC-like DNA-binding protein